MLAEDDINIFILFNGLRLLQCTNMMEPHCQTCIERGRLNSTCGNRATAWARTSIEHLIHSDSWTFRYVSCACGDRDGSWVPSFIVLIELAIIQTRSEFVFNRGWGARDCVCCRAQLERLEAFLHSRACWHDAPALQRMHHGCWVLQWSLDCTRLWYVACCACSLFKTLMP